MVDVVIFSRHIRVLCSGIVIAKRPHNSTVFPHPFKCTVPLLPFTTFHNLAHDPKEVPNREAGMFGVGGYMLGQRLLLRLERPLLRPWVISQPLTWVVS